MQINGSKFPALADGFEVEVVRAEQQARTITNTHRYLRLGPPKRRWSGVTRPMPRADAEGWLALDGQVVTVQWEDDGVGSAVVGQSVVNDAFTARMSAHARPWGPTALWEVLFILEEV